MARARRDEVRLINALIDGGEGDEGGVIGAVAKEQLKQLPSYAYWNGLEMFGIRLYHGSIDQYHRSLDSYYQLQLDLPKPEGGEPVEGLRPNWHAGLPPAPDGLLDEATFTLTADEATYLRERIRVSAPGSLLDALVSRGRPARHVLFAWRHPDVRRLSKELTERLEFARVLSEVMQGASLLYNLMLSERREFKARTTEYRSRLEDWSREVAVTSHWSWDEFWAVALLSNPRIPQSTRRFVERWFDFAGIGPKVVDDRKARAVISDRERVTKGSQSRLHNRRALELYGGRSGVSQLSYRWPVVERLINDILRGIAATPG
jgi:Family of unknown function (DUF6361)